MESPTTPRQPDTVVLTVSGMTCGGCASTVTRVLMRVHGVTDARVDLGGGRATVTGTAPPRELLAAIAAAGFEGGLA